MPAHSRATARPSTSLVEVIWRHRWMVAVSTVVCVAAALAYLVTAVPLYTGESRLVVEQIGPKVLENMDTSNKSETFLYTQAELIKSIPVLEMAVQTLWKSRPQAFQEVDNPAMWLKKNLNIVVGKKDNIISVSLELPDAQEAAQVVNGVVEAYVKKYAEQKRSTTVEVLKILQREKDKRDREFEDLRKQALAFRTKNPTVSVAGDSESVTTRRCLQLSDELTRAEIELLQAKERFDNFAKMRATPEQVSKLVEAAVAQGTIRLDLTLDQQIHVQQLLLATESKKFGEGHPKVKALQGPLEELQQEARKLKSKTVTAYLDGLQYEYDLQYKLVQAKVEKLKRDYDAQFEVVIKALIEASGYTFLVDDLHRSEKRSDTLVGRIMDLSVTEDVGALNITVMEFAQAGGMTSPKRSRILGLGLIGGLMLGFGLALLRDFFDHRLRSADEIVALLELPLLGIVPNLKGKVGRSATGQMVASHPRSEFAESFRTLRTAIYFGLPDSQTKTILVVSPSPGDGKSIVASNLAIAMAQADQSVLLIEADFRKPTQKEIFGLEKTRGFSDVLAQQDALDSVILETPIKGLSLLPCGTIPTNPVEILNGQAFRQALEVLSQRYDKIVIDAPPVVAVADSRVLGALCDVTLLVLRAEKSTRRHSLGARDELLSVGARILGVVVNSVPSGKGRYAYGYYGYGHYGYRRGQKDGSSDTSYKYDETPSETLEKVGAKSS
ncbi:MAG: polysaccharide biosynthesis tyrosine autokinase [Planctomycetota bacterium]